VRGTRAKGAAVPYSPPPAQNADKLGGAKDDPDTKIEVDVDGTVRRSRR
jgi:hypothetical protein